MDILLNSAQHHNKNKRKRTESYFYHMLIYSPVAEMAYQGYPIWTDSLESKV